MTTIYTVDTFMKNPDRRHFDKRTDYDAAMSYFYGVRENPDCISIEVCKWTDSEDSDIMECEVIASYS